MIMFTLLPRSGAPSGVLIWAVARDRQDALLIVGRATQDPRSTSVRVMGDPLAPGATQSERTSRYVS